MRVCLIDKTSSDGITPTLDVFNADICGIGDGLLYLE